MEVRTPESLGTFLEENSVVLRWLEPKVMAKFELGGLPVIRRINRYKLVEVW